MFKGATYREYIWNIRCVYSKFYETSQVSFGTLLNEIFFYMKTLNNQLFNRTDRRTTALIQGTCWTLQQHRKVHDSKKCNLIVLYKSDHAHSFMRKAVLECLMSKYFKTAFFLMANRGYDLWLYKSIQSPLFCDLSKYFPNGFMGSTCTI